MLELSKTQNGLFLPLLYTLFMIGTTLLPPTSHAYYSAFRMLICYTKLNLENGNQFDCHIQKL